MLDGLTRVPMHMEITSVETVPLRKELEEPFANSQKWIAEREYCLVRIETRDGITGWGECWGPIAGNREVIDEQVAPWLIGETVCDRDAILDELRFQLRSAYHSYVPASAISGIDIALWDAYGRSSGASIAELLGGRRRDRVPAYATGHYFRDVNALDELLEKITAEARSHVQAGFDALKLKIGLKRHFGWGASADLDLVRAVRETVGPDVSLMVDANHAYDSTTARRVADGLAEFDVTFFEEPVPPQIDLYRSLAPESSVPIAAGECFAFAESFGQLFAANALDYAQPDVTSAGGVAETYRIARRAADANVPCYPHVFGSGVALAASLQVIAALPGRPILEFDRTPNPLREELVEPAIDNEGTDVPIPSGDGLGVDIEPAALESFRVERPTN